jgi:hypothetical protein
VKRGHKIHGTSQPRVQEDSDKLKIAHSHNTHNRILKFKTTKRHQQTSNRI